MITAKEFRLGNYILYNGLYMAIDGIQSPAPRKEERFSDKWIVDLFDGAGLITATSEEIASIELTESWIEKLNFEFYKPLNHWRIVIDDIWYSIRKTDLGFVFTFVNLNADETQYMPLKTIKYVHKLQNLFFELSNKELKL